MDQATKARAFRALHEGDGAFIVPNPWDAGSARILAGLGFEALATTSAGFAYAAGRKDGTVGREAMVAHVRDIAEATDLPVSADLENCYAHDPKEAARTLVMAAEAGAVGGSIEDFAWDHDPQIYDFDHAVERVAAAVEAVRALNVPFTLTARAENLIRGRPDLDDTIRRLLAFEAAGADVLYAPGLKTIEEVRAVCAAVSRPVNVLVRADFTLDRLAQAGAKRISVGGALYGAVISGLLAAGREMCRSGTFTWARGGPLTTDIADLMRSQET